MKARTLVIVGFALAGGFASARLMPVLLDTISVRVQRMITGPVEPSVGPVPAGTVADKVSKAQPDQDEPVRYTGSSSPMVLAALALLGLIVGGGLGTLFVRSCESINERWTKMEIGDKVTIFLGIFVGVVGSLPFLIAFQGLGGVAGPLLTLPLTIGFSALSVLAMRSMDEVLPWQRISARRRKTGIKVLDTNVLIDGRIYDLVRTGFLEGELYVPAFVLQELQHIADSSDALRRQRGRRGLDVLKMLQAEHTIEVGTHDKYVPDDKEEVDGRLVKLAKVLGGDLVSNDYNLNRVASIQEVRVLNINDLALSLKPNVLPGERLDVMLIREGNQPGQGVGYLDDGTMVVVEHGRHLIGETVNVGVTQVIQTERGKMIFADANH